MSRNFYGTPAHAVGKVLGAGVNTMYSPLSRGAYATIQDINLCNVTGGAATVTIEWFDKSENFAFTVAKSLPVAANSQVTYSLDAFGIDPLDELRVTPSAAATIHCVATYVETPGRNG